MLAFIARFELCMCFLIASFFIKINSCKSLKRKKCVKKILKLMYELYLASATDRYACIICMYERSLDASTGFGVFSLHFN